MAPPYQLRPRHGLGNRGVVPGEFPNPAIPNVDTSTGGDDSKGISDAASLRSAPGSLQRVRYSRVVSPRNPSVGDVPEAALAHRAQGKTPSKSASNSDAGSNNEQGLLSPVKREQEGEALWITVGRDGKHRRSASRASINSAPQRGPLQPLSVELAAAEQPHARHERNLLHEEHDYSEERFRRMHEENNATRCPEGKVFHKGNKCNS